MEFLRDGNINMVESVTETSEDKGIMDSGADPESRLGGPAAVELETPEAWPDHQSRINRETSAKWVIWLHIIGENREYFFPDINKQIYFIIFREEGFAFCCALSWWDIFSCCSHILFSKNQARSRP